MKGMAMPDARRVTLRPTSPPAFHARVAPARAQEAPALTQALAPLLFTHATSPLPAALCWSRDTGALPAQRCRAAQRCALAAQCRLRHAREVSVLSA